MYRNPTEKEKLFVAEYTTKKYNKLWLLCLYVGIIFLAVFGWFFTIFIASFHKECIPYFVFGPFGAYFVYLARKIEKERRLFKSGDFMIQDIKILKQSGIRYIKQTVTIQCVDGIEETVINLCEDVSGCDEGYLVLPVSERIGDVKPRVIPIKY